MRFKKLFSILMILCIILSFPLCAFADGKDEKAASETVSISSLDEFLEFSKKCTLSSYSENRIFELGCDIDLTGTDFEPVPCFLGIFHGNNHTVKGLKVTRDGSRQGLFRVIDAGAEVSSLRVLGSVTPSGTQCFIGGIAGSNSGTISRCSFEGTVEGIDDIGGIAGENTAEGSIVSCTVSGNINGEHRTGGIAGTNTGLIQRCTNWAKVNTVSITPEGETHFNLASITTDDFLDITSVGGISGYNSGDVVSCKNKADIGYTNIGYNVGGVVGINYGYIASSSSSGKILGRKDVGGICGQLIPYTELDLDVSKINTLQGSIDVLNAQAKEAAEVAKDQALDVAREAGRVADISRNLANGVKENDSAKISQAATDLYAEQDMITSLAETVGGELGERAVILSNSIANVFNNIAGIAQSIDGDLVEITDISVEQAYDKNESAIDSCENYGNVTSESNAGGIAGCVAFEISFDAEDSLDMSDYVFTDAKEYLYSSIRKCKSFGCTETKSDNAGGIVGTSDIGIVIDCIGAGSVSSRNGDYVGGICGNSKGTVKNCSTRVLLSGRRYIGGIAGNVTDILSCKSYPVFDSYSEYAGAVAGFCDGKAEGNIYVECTPAGIDGISYISQCSPTTYKALSLDSGVGDLFDDITVRFIGPNGKPVKVVEMNFGEKVSEFPEIAMDGDKYWKWDTADLDAIYFSTDIQGQYCSPLSTLSTGEEVPLILVEGQFYDGQKLSVIPYSNTEIEDPIVSNTVSVSDYDGDLVVRMFAEKDAVLYILQDDGSLKRSSFTTDGRYRVFNLKNGGSFVYAPLLEKETVIKGAAVLAALGAIAAAAVVYLIVKKKKAPEKEDKQEQ